MKKKYRLIIVGIVLFLILLSFFITFINDKKYNEKIDTIKEEVLNYLYDKYNEQFNIVDFSHVRNTYNIEEGEELVTKEMNSSYIYTFKMSSSRLVEFDVIYVVYEDEEEYIKYKEYNIVKEGLYENYIYEYKIKEVRREIKDKVYDFISDSSSFDVYIDYFEEDSILIDYSLDDKETKNNYDEYRSLNKNVSNRDWFETCLSVNDNYSLVIDINVDNYISNDNLSNFKDEVRDLVLYLEDLGYSNYDINFTFKNYVTGRATQYLDDSYEQIYLIFAYKENFSNIEEKDMLTAYIIDK